MATIKIPLIIRGTVIEDYECTVVDRDDPDRALATPDLTKYLDQVMSQSPEELADLYKISFESILDYLHELGSRLNLDTNVYWREAFEASCGSSRVSRPVLEAIYRSGPETLHRDSAREVAETRIGVAYLEGWTPTTLRDGRVIEVRAVGSRAVHVIAGNVPLPSLTTVLRSAITRGDAVVKIPWNDPLTMVAIARTMIDMAPEHPLTRHMTVCYWKSGDPAIEARLYRPQHVEKIVVWGGNRSLRHITPYLQAGVDLVALDPKSSTTLIGKDALADDSVMRTVARRAAADVGGWDQEACVNARVLFLESGTDPKGLRAANRFGSYLFEEIQRLPKSVSAGPTWFDPRLRDELLSIMQQGHFYQVMGGRATLEQTGAVVVSQIAEPVDFSSLLFGRVCNLVPVDQIEEAFAYFSSATQTVGVYPDALRMQIRDRAALMGGQWFVPLGYALSGSPVMPQDGIEPERRMCRWVVDARYESSRVRGPWMPEDVADGRGNLSSSGVPDEYSHHTDARV